MDMTKNPADMSYLELSTAVYHISANNQTAKTFTLQKVTDILTEASRRLRDGDKGKPSPVVSFPELGDSGPAQDPGENYKAVITTVNNLTGEVEQGTIDIDGTKLTVDQLRQHITEREQRDPLSAEAKVRSAWTFNPEDLDDLVGDPEGEDQ
jgi:hypothetical protein